MTHPFDALDQLASLDGQLRQLARTRETLSATIGLDALRERIDELDQSIAVLAQNRRPLEDALGALEAEVTTLAQRRAAIEARLASATGASRDLTAMDAERRHLAELQVALEDRELALMEDIEPINERMAGIAEAIAPLASQRAELDDVLRTRQGELDAEIADHIENRQATAGILDPDLLARYETISGRVGGSGSARLIDGHCGGCHLVLSTVELDSLRRRPLDEISTCEQCGRILIRPAQLDD